MLADKIVDVLQAAPLRTMLVDPALTCLGKRDLAGLLLARDLHRVIAFKDHNPQFSCQLPSVGGAVFRPWAYRSFGHPVRARLGVTVHPSAACGGSLEEKAIAQVESPRRKGLNFAHRGHGPLDVSHGGSENLQWISGLHCNLPCMEVS